MTDPTEPVTDPQPVESIHETLRQRIADVRTRLDSLLSPTADAEAVHDYRVALRRLRSSLRVLELTAGKKRVRPLADRLRTAANFTGELRDEEVLRETLDELHHVGGEALARWKVGRARRETGLRRRVVRGLHEAEQGTVRDTLAALDGLLTDLERPVGVDEEPGQTDAEIAAAALERAVEKIGRRAAAIRDADVEAMHRLRIAVKQLRYATELVGRHVAGDTARIDKITTKLQKQLGRVHDLDQAATQMQRAWGLDRGTRLHLLEAILAQRKKLAHHCVSNAENVVRELRAAIAPS